VRQFVGSASRYKHARSIGLSQHAFLLNVPVIIMHMSQLTFTTQQLAQQLGGTLHGPGEVVITGVQSLVDAGPGDVSFIIDARYARAWSESKAGAVIVSDGLEVDAADGRPRIVVPNAELATARVLELFQQPEWGPEPGVDPTARIHPTATLGQQVRIGAYVSVGPGCRIGNGVVLHDGVRLYANVTIGDGCVLHANTVIRDRCTLGRGVILHQNVSIGADGFGYRPAPNGAGLIKIPHIGTVIIEDGVEIGANSCVDRGKFGPTVIGAGTKIDNLCQIGHNCRIGRCCVIAGCTGLSGSVTVGDGVQMGGACGIADHVTIGSGARIGGFSMVIRDVMPGQTVLGHPAEDGRTALRQWACVRKLPGLLQQLSKERPA